MTRKCFGLLLAIVAIFLLTVADKTKTQEVPAKRPTMDELAKDNNLFLSLSRKALKWDEPAEPIKIVGPLYFVGTQGLGSFLFTTPEGHILMNTGMPTSAPLIIDSIRKLGFKPEDIRIIINGHAHSDRAGAFAELKKLSGAKIAIMAPDVQAIEDGGKDDFFYGADWKIMGFPPAKVDRVLRDGDTVKLGEIVLTAHHTPGHTRGSTTWTTILVDSGAKPIPSCFPMAADSIPVIDSPNLRLTPALATTIAIPFTSSKC